MRYRPTFDEFAELAKDYTLVPVYRQLIGDTLTPVTAFCKIQEGDWSFLFESVVGGEIVGRYSFVGAGPFARFESYNDDVKWHTKPMHSGAWACENFKHPDPLKVLEDKLAAYRAPHLPGLPRFLGGAVGYASYDSVRYVEHLPGAPPDDRKVPD